MSDISASSEQPSGILTRYARTVGELRRALVDLPDDFGWHGWDDESLIITSSPDSLDEVCHIDNRPAAG